ncbi:MAG: PKD domain-containing protein [Candidatus Paceibacterota bacterium]
MKYRMIRLVLVLLAVLIAGCDVNQPHQELEQEPEEPKMVRAFIWAPEIVEGDSVRVETATIVADGGDYNQKVISTNGIFDEMLIAQDVDVKIYAYADGYKPSDTLTVNLNSEVNEALVLEREDEKPEPEGPGKLEFTAESCADDGSVDNGTLTVTAENGFTAIRLINVENNEVVKDIAELTPKENQEYTFTRVPNGEYKAVATLNERESTTKETVTVDCEAQEAPNKAPKAKLDITTDGLTALYDASGSSDTDGTIEKYLWDFDNDDEIDEETDGPTIDREFSEGGNYTGRVVVVDNDSATDEATEDFMLEEPMGPGMIKELKTVCSAFDDGKIKIRTRNGFSSISLMQNGTQVQYYDELPVEEHQEFTFTDVPAGTYSVIPQINNRTNEKVVTVKACEKPKARFTSEADGFTVHYDASGSSSENGDIVTYEWDWTDDGTFDEETTDPQPSFEHNEEGPIQTRLRVTDLRGLTAETTGEVNPFQPNKEPVAHLEDTNHGLTIVYDASGSYDPDGEIVEYRWDWMNDGQIDSVTTTPIVEYTFDDEGDFYTRVVVVDNDGATAEATTRVCPKVLLSDEYQHWITFGGNRDIWVSDYQNRPIDDLLKFGEVRPILSDENPYGLVYIESKFKADPNKDQRFLLEIYYNEDGSDVFRTPIYPDQTGVDGWTTATTSVDASNFAGHAKDIAGVRVIHANSLDENGSTDPDSVYFSTENDEDGELWFRWRVQLNGPQKALAQSTEYESTVTESGTTTRALN